MTLDPGVQSGDTPPYGIILDSLRDGTIIPFLGAAASTFGCTNGGSCQLPSGSQLARSLASKAGFPSTNDADLEDLTKVSSYYVDVSNRPRLRKQLRSVFAPEDESKKYRCNDLHRFLARIANNMMILTTNYDTMLEQAFIEAGKPYELVVYPADNTEFANAIMWWRQGAAEPEPIQPNCIDVAELGKTNVIYKMHGSVREDVDKFDSFVITEEDYTDFLSRMDSAVPPAFSEYFHDRGFLFLGYGLKDWNLRVLLRKIREKRADADVQNRIPNYAMLLNPPAFERRIWGNRGVDIFDTGLDDFVQGMQKELSKT